MDKGMNFFYILSAPLGYVMEWIYKLLPNYGWDIILFTLLINIVKIPLQLSQQKSMAKMSAFQPMLQEIQTKYKDKPEKQQEEMLKLQQDYGYKPTAGCVPMMQGSMKVTMYLMPLMYLFFCFTYPLAFSLYYVISNIVMTAQTQVMRKIYDPEKMRKEEEAQIEEKKKQQKRGVKSTTVKVTDPKTGKVTEKNLSASEMNKRRLEYARQLDAERYKDERTVPLSELNKQDKE